MSSVNKYTKIMQSMMPQWMKMAKDPASIGAQFLNVFGLEFEDIETYLNDVVGNQYIETADVRQIDITYKVPLALPIVLDFEAIDSVSATTETGTHHFKVCQTLRDFYGKEAENKAILDREQGALYLRPVGALNEGEKVVVPFTSIEINGTTHFEYSLHHVWNAFDEFGLLLGIERLYAERNEAFKERILDVFRRPGNSTKQGLLNAISRELRLEDDEVKIHELGSSAFKGSLLNEDGTPTSRLLSYVSQVNKVFGFTWDNMAWGEAYWHSVEEQQIGLEYLPHMWDPKMASWNDTDFQSGVGDGNDLKVRAPKEESNTRDFKYYVGVRGRKSGLEEMNPELSFRYKITAHGRILDEEYKPELYKYTVVASEIIKLNYIIRSMQDFFYTTQIDFNASTPGYMYDDAANPSIEMIKGTTNLSKSSAQYKYHKVIVDLETNSAKDTPKLKNLSIKWRDSGGALRTYTLDTQNELTKNDVVVDTDLSDVLVGPEGSVELGFGEFYSMIDTEGSFKEGQRSPMVKIENQGFITLSLPKA